MLSAQTNSLGRSYAAAPITDWVQSQYRALVSLQVMAYF